MGKSLFTSSFKKIPYGIVWMIVIFILLEAATRLLWNPNIIGERLYGIFDPSYNYGYDLEMPVFYKKDDRYICYPTQYLNLHKQFLGNIKDDNKFRIFTFGGSVSRGQKESNYSYFLENLLNSNYPNNQFKVINFSADGYGSSRMLLLLKKVIKFKPDLLIWHIHGSNEYEDERDFKYRNTVNSGFNKLIFSSHFLVIVKKCYSYMAAFENTVVSDIENEREANKKIENIQKWYATIDQNLSEMLKIAKNHKIPVFLIGRIEKKFGNSEFETQRVIKINNIIKKHLKNNVHFIDTPMIMQKNYPDVAARKAIFIDSSHWIQQGHEVVAREIANDIDKLFNWSSVVHNSP